MEHDESQSDEILAVAASGGERGAFEELVARYGAHLIGVLERQIGDEHRALDLAQEIWVKVFRALPRFRPEGSFRSWLFSIALNHVRDDARSGKRSKVVYLEDFRAPSPALATDPRGRTEEQAAIQSALDQVIEPFRSAVVLVDVMGLSYEEAAVSLDCRVGTVKSRVNRGRLAFKTEYEKQAERNPRIRAVEGPTP